MLNVLIGIAIVVAIGAAAFFAAEYVVSLRRDKEAIRNEKAQLLEEVEGWKEHALALQMQLKSVEQRTMADIDRDPFQDFRR